MMDKCSCVAGNFRIVNSISCILIFSMLARERREVVVTSLLTMQQDTELDMWGGGRGRERDGNGLRKSTARSLFITVQLSEYFFLSGNPDSIFCSLS